MCVKKSSSNERINRILKTLLMKSIIYLAIQLAWAIIIRTQNHARTNLCCRFLKPVGFLLSFELSVNWNTFQSSASLPSSMFFNFLISLLWTLLFRHDLQEKIYRFIFWFQMDFRITSKNLNYRSDPTLRFDERMFNDVTDPLHPWMFFSNTDQETLCFFYTIYTRLENI